jgi:hypothetical protein
MTMTQTYARACFDEYIAGMYVDNCDVWGVQAIGKLCDIYYKAVRHRELIERMITLNGKEVK